MDWKTESFDAPFDQKVNGQAHFYKKYLLMLRYNINTPLPLNYQ